MKSAIPLTIKTRRSQKQQEKLIQKNHLGFRLNPYYEQKDFQYLKPKNKSDLSILSTPKTLKRTRGRPPKRNQIFANDTRKKFKAFLIKLNNFKRNGKYCDYKEGRN